MAAVDVYTTEGVSYLFDFTVVRVLVHSEKSVEVILRGCPRRRRCYEDESDEQHRGEPPRRRRRHLACASLCARLTVVILFGTILEKGKVFVDTKKPQRESNMI